MVATRKSQSKRTDKAPLDVQLTVRFRFGDAPDDEVTMIDDRRVPMVGSVFDKRDMLVRNFVQLLLRASARQPRVLRELMPSLRLMRRD